MAYINPPKRAHEPDSAICWYSEIYTNSTDKVKDNRRFYLIVEDHTLLESYRDFFSSLKTDKPLTVLSSLENGEPLDKRHDSAGKPGMQKFYKSELARYKLKNFILLFDRDYDYLINEKFYQMYCSSKNIVYLDKYCFESYFVSPYYFIRSVARAIKQDNEQVINLINFDTWEKNIATEYARILPAIIALRSGNEPSLIVQDINELFTFPSNYSIELKSEYNSIIDPKCWDIKIYGKCYAKLIKTKYDLDMYLNNKMYSRILDLVPGKQLLSLFLKLWKYSYNTHVRCSKYSTCSHAELNCNHLCQYHVPDNYDNLVHISKHITDLNLYNTELKPILEKLEVTFSKLKETE